MRPSDDKHASPKLTPAGAAAQLARAERLSEALRANLKRRKAQARGRTAETEDADPKGGESA